MGTLGRDGRPYRRLCTEVRAQQMPCWLCGWNIDYTLPGTHAMSFTLDHVTPVSRGGSVLDPANARAAHRRCNSSKGARDGLKRPDSPRRW